MVHDEETPRSQSNSAPELRQAMASELRSAKLAGLTPEAFFDLRRAVRRLLGFNGIGSSRRSSALRVRGT